jgi:hypothetical protein
VIGSQPAAALDDVQRLRAAGAVSWGAIIAGAAAGIATSVVLVALGAGLGFESIHPWSRGASVTTFAISGAIWLIVTQWLSSALGGYLTGRLRHRWLATHTHEVFFRDTAHGLVTWSVATLAVVLVAGASLTSVGGAAARAGIGAGAGTMRAIGPDMRAMGPDGGMGQEGMQYGVDRLFRGATGPRPMDLHAEALHIAGEVLAGDARDADGIAAGISAEDRSYLVSLVAMNTGISTEDAQKRVDAFIAQVKESAARAKKAAQAASEAAAQAAIYTALAMLIGAFIASVAAAIGGRLRDEHL